MYNNNTYDPAAPLRQRSTSPYRQEQQTMSNPEKPAYQMNNHVQATQKETLYQPVRSPLHHSPR